MYLDRAQKAMRNKTSVSDDMGIRMGYSVTHMLALHAM